MLGAAGRCLLRLPNIDLHVLLPRFRVAPAVLRYRKVSAYHSSHLNVGQFMRLMLLFLVCHL